MATAVSSQFIGDTQAKREAIDEVPWEGSLRLPRSDRDDTSASIGENNKVWVYGQYRGQGPTAQRKTTGYKTGMAGELVDDSEPVEEHNTAYRASKMRHDHKSPTLSSAMKVNPEVARRSERSDKTGCEANRNNSVFLPGEASLPCGVGLNPPSRRRGLSSNGRSRGGESVSQARDRSSRLYRVAPLRQRSEQQRAGVAADPDSVGIQRRYPDGSLAMKDRTWEVDSYP